MPAKLTSRLPQISAELQARVSAGMAPGVEAIAIAAKAQAPDRPPIGQGLVETIEARPEDDGDWGVYAAWYSRFLENGTSRAAPKPFLIPAAEAGKDEVAAGVTAALRAL